MSMHLAELDRRHSTICIHCEHPISGSTPQAVADSIGEHARFVIATKDHETDPHFEDARLTALVAQ